ncbi:NAD(P)-binding protein [Exidia glandulosa HHB12029]|uniref:NAD(P)-binding protein n=1 Tax=Exidia glandulosa HHB12029 TaxID=1314781 RepID=A0A166ASV4_EXIGL|nr:NAD(P)-binding protein [Exidia glandulosa HHB12029]
MSASPFSPAYAAQTPDELFALLNAGPLFNLDGLVAVITGGASGIGLMIGTTLLANGAVVHVVDRSKDDLQNVQTIYSAKAAGRLLVHEADVSLKSEATRIAEVIAQSSPYVNVLFNNAGISGAGAPVPKDTTDPKAFVEAMNALDENAFNSVFAVNTFSAYFFAVAFLPLLCASAENPAGNRFPPQIINTCSLNAWSNDLATSWGKWPYQLSKGAIHHLTKLLAHELIPLKVRVNGFAPGLFATGMTRSLAARTPLGFTETTPAQFNGESVIGYGNDFKLPVKEGARFEDLSGLALMLVTNRFVNGEIVLIDGGSLLRHVAY